MPTVHPIRIWRLFLGWSQRELATRAGVTQNMISLIERGLVPTREVQKRVARACGHRVAEAFPPTKDEVRA